jgi:hypothetical protein
MNARLPTKRVGVAIQIFDVLPKCYRVLDRLVMLDSDLTAVVDDSNGNQMNYSDFRSRCAFPGGLIVAAVLCLALFADRATGRQAHLNVPRDETSFDVALKGADWEVVSREIVRNYFDQMLDSTRTPGFDFAFEASVSYVNLARTTRESPSSTSNTSNATETIVSVRSPEPVAVDLATYHIGGSPAPVTELFLTSAHRTLRARFAEGQLQQVDASGNVVASEDQIRLLLDGWQDAFLFYTPEYFARNFSLWLTPTKNWLTPTKSLSKGPRFEYLRHIASNGDIYLECRVVDVNGRPTSERRIAILKKIFVDAAPLLVGLQSEFIGRSDDANVLIRTSWSFEFAEFGDNPTNAHTTARKLILPIRMTQIMGLSPPIIADIVPELIPSHRKDFILKPESVVHVSHSRDSRVAQSRDQMLSREIVTVPGNIGSIVSLTPQGLPVPPDRNSWGMWTFVFFLSASAVILGIVLRQWTSGSRTQIRSQL